MRPDTTTAAAASASSGVTSSTNTDNRAAIKTAMLRRVSAKTCCVLCCCNYSCRVNRMNEKHSENHTLLVTSLRTIRKNPRYTIYYLPCRPSTC